MSRRAPCRAYTSWYRTSEQRARSFWNGGKRGPRPRGVLYASLGDPDDNGWTLQQVPY